MVITKPFYFDFTKKIFKIKNFKQKLRHPLVEALKVEA